ncbi:hypothetical protein [Agromyces sp. S2-1-8]|uniref:RCC1 domain-containing protein n=1 Tax=Agromyces sp. S2-1-8 TaxID=2897180 RepID=UPI001E544766|nr:hypothetical protein [Agromyces sp. S2-1-8]MCD5348388.1 hypothetical protein [Agromyces sp. S2-1-8]
MTGGVTQTSASFTDAGYVDTEFATVPAVELDFVGLDAGETYSLGWTADGRLYSWGANDRGQLGLGDDAPRTVPTQVIMPEGAQVARASAGINTSIAVTTTGEAYTWGNPDVGGNTSTPTRVEALVGEDIVGVSSGGYFYLAWTSDGSLYSWGEPGGGRLGRGGDAQVPGRVTAQGVNTLAVTTADAGRFFGTASLSDGATVVMWGQDYSGTGGVTASGLPAESPTAGLSAGNKFVFAWTENGALYSTTTSAFALVSPPANIIGAEVTIQAAGPSSYFVWRSTGELFSWGSNSAGQLGLGDTVDRSTPTLVTLPAGAQPLSVAAGGAHALLAAGNGTFSAAGSNGLGQLGTNDTVGRNTFSTPVLIERWP